jgi:hypothetical protein
LSRRISAVCRCSELRRATPSANTRFPTPGTAARTPDATASRPIWRAGPSPRSRSVPLSYTAARFVRSGLDAKRKLDLTAPLDAAATESGYGPAVLSVFHGTNLLSPFEKTKLTPLLRGPSADAFVRAAAAFTLGAVDPALQELRRIAHPFESAKWTVLTYLPFLWRPDAHMFLKPTVTQDFAERIGHPFAQAYGPELDIAIYESLLDLVRRTEADLAQLGPRDRIDVQSFIWVVGSYEDAPGTGDPNSR